MFCVYLCFYKQSLKSKKTLIGSKERRLSNSIAFKIEVVNYAEKKHENRAAERRDFSGSDEDFLGFYDE
jgi:hypothetical protein